MIRNSLATAASSVEGITAHPYYVQTTKAGTAWVRLDRVDYPNDFGGVAHWGVVVLLPADLASAEKYLEEKLPLLHEALSPHLYIDSASPERIDMGQGVLSCLFIRGHREQE